MKHKLIMLLMCMLAMLPTGAFAATITECDYNRDDKAAAVSGETERGDASEVTISVKNRDTGVVYYEGQKKAVDGKYTFEFTLTGDGVVTYDIKVGEFAVLAATTGELVYYGSQSATILETLNDYITDNDTDNFRTTLSSSLAELGIVLTDDEQVILNNITERVMDAGTENGEYAKVNDLKTKVYDEVFLYRLMNAADEDEIEAIITDKPEYASDKYPNTYALYDGLSDKSGICKEIQKGIDETLTVDKFQTLFIVKAGGNLIKKADGWSAAKTVISKIQSEVGIVAETLSSVSGVYTDMMNGSYTVFTDFNTNYSNAVKNNPADEDEEEDDKKPPMGGGGGGGGTSVVAPPGPTQAPTQTPSEPNTNTSAIFTDIENVEWAREAIEALAADGVINGKEEGKFAPNDNILREEVVAMMVRLLDLKVPEEKSGFSDVAQGAWCEDYCYAVRDAGLVNGIDSNNFGIGMNITRQDLITIMYRAIEKYGYKPEVNEDTAPFTDMDTFADYAVDAAQFLKSCGIIDGRDSGKFYPNENITRAETAKVLYALRNLKIESDYVVTGGAK